MSDRPNDWDKSTAAQRREGFFAPSTPTTAGASRPPGPSRVTTLPERPHRRSTPHPSAGTSGQITQDWDDDAPGRAGTGRRRSEEDGYSERPSLVADEQLKSNRRYDRQPPSSVNTDPRSGTLSSNAEGKKPALRSGPRAPQVGSGDGSNSERRVGFGHSDDVKYPVRRGSESSPESAPVQSQENRREDRDGGVGGVQFGGPQDNRPRYGQTRTDHTQVGRNAENDGYKRRTGSGEARRSAEETRRSEPRRRDDCGEGRSGEYEEPARRHHDGGRSRGSRDEGRQEYSDEGSSRENDSHGRERSSGSKSRREHRRPRPPKKVGTVEKVLKEIDRFFS